MICVGIDYSISSPSVCVHSGADDGEFSIENCHFLSIPPFKKRTPFAGCYDGKYYMVENLGSSVFSIERMVHLGNVVTDFITARNATSYCIEGYAFGGSGQVFQLAENCGILKANLHQNNIKQTATPTPGEIKKLATGKGNAKKAQMVDAFVSETGVNLYDVLELEYNPIKHSMHKIPSPIDDMVDAYYICKYHHTIQKDNKTK